MFDGIVEKIRQKNRTEWQEYFSDKLTDLRIWVQENGEKAAGVFFLSGIFIAVAFKLFFALLLLSVLLVFGIWSIALPGGEAMADDINVEVHAEGAEDSSESRESESEAEDLMH